MSVRKYRTTVRRSQCADFHQLGNAAAPVGVGLEYVNRIGLKQLQKPPTRVFVLPGGDRHTRGPLDGREVANSIRWHGLLEPTWTVLGDAFQQTDDVRDVATHETVEHDLDVRTCRLTDGACQVHVALHAFQAIAGAVTKEPLLGFVALLYDGLGALTHQARVERVA